MNKAEREALIVRTIVASTSDEELQKKKIKDHRKIVYASDVARANNMKSFRMRKQKDELGRYKIEVIEGFGFDENPKKIIFWLMAPSVEDYKIFHSILTKRIAKEFGCKEEQVHFSYQTGDIDA